MAEPSYKIVEEIGKVTNNEGKWNIEHNLVQWYENQPKHDIRSWAPEHAKCGKGLTLTDAEFEALKAYFKSLD